jgi:hypothetical protein
LSKQNRLKRLEKLVGTVDMDSRDDCARLLEAWYACKLERFESLRDDKYTPPTDAQRALVAATPYERVIRAFATCVPIRLMIAREARRAFTTTDDDAQNGSSGGP